MKFKQKGREEQAEPDGLEAGTNAATLLGTDPEAMYKNICKPRIKVDSYTFAKYFCEFHKLCQIITGRNRVCHQGSKCQPM